MKNIIPLGLKILVTFAFLNFAYGQSTVYKWTDTTGRVHYSQTPPNQLDSLMVEVLESSGAYLVPKNRRVESEPSSLQNNSIRETQESQTTPSVDDVSTSSQPAIDSITQKRNAERCEEARGFLSNLTQYLDDDYQEVLIQEEDGTTYVLSEEEFQELQRQTEKDVDFFCQ